MTSTKQQPIQVKVGKNTDNEETLEVLCREKAEEFRKAFAANPGEFNEEVVFWTSSPKTEFIGAAYFKRNDNGEISYDLDFSESTVW